MSEETPEAYSLMCSSCHTPCTGDDAHVIPHWNPDVQRVLTTYRCGNCWIPGLDEMRAAITSGEAGVAESLGEFLTRHGWGKDVPGILAQPPAAQQQIFLAFLDAVQDGRVVFNP